MSHQQNVINKKWNEIKKDTQQTWMKLSDYELDKAMTEIRAIGSFVEKSIDRALSAYQKKLKVIMKGIDVRKNVLEGKSLKKPLKRK